MVEEGFAYLGRIGGAHCLLLLPALETLLEPIASSPVAAAVCIPNWVDDARSKQSHLLQFCWFCDLSLVHFLACHHRERHIGLVSELQIDCRRTLGDNLQLGI